jgi:hypothetical protein
VVHREFPDLNHLLLRERERYHWLRESRRRRT